MKVFVDSENRIHDVGSTQDTSLTELVINDSTNPFKDWSTAKICCHKVSVSDGAVTMYTPYVPSSLIHHIDQLGKQAEKAQAETDVANATVDGIMTDMLPTLAETDESITATIDYIMTDVIPSLMGE